MKPDAGLRGLLQIADDVARLVDGIRDADDEDSPGGRKVTPGEVAKISGAGARLVAHCAGMLAGMIAGGGRK